MTDTGFSETAIAGSERFISAVVATEYILEENYGTDGLDGLPDRLSRPQRRQL